MATLKLTRPGPLSKVIFAVVLVPIVGVMVFTESTCACGSKEKAYIASMKSDLRNLVAAQEIYFADSLSYSEVLPPGFVTSTYVTLDIVSADSNDAGAEATHEMLGWKCSITWSVGTYGEPLCVDASGREKGPVTKFLEGLGRKTRW